MLTMLKQTKRKEGLASRRKFCGEVAEPSYDVAGETTYHVWFYLLPNASVSTRYTKAFDFFGGMYDKPYIYNNAHTIDLTTAVPQHPLTWNVMLVPQGGGTPTSVATFSKPRMSEDVELTVDDMPTSLKRHYLDYTGIYATSDCLGEAGSYTITADDSQNIYVKATYTADAPTFYEAAGNETTDKWHMIHTGNNILYAGTDATVKCKYEPNVNETDRNDEQFLWRLIGTPYGVQLYNKSTRQYVTFPSTNAGTVLTLTDGVTTMDLMDDYNGGLAAISYLSGTTRVYADIDYTVNSPFEWSTSETAWTGKHWYYMANNHRPSGELGRMVYRDSSPKLRVSTALVDNRLYLNNFEWCVIGDPYGFKMLNRYDPDQQFNEYIRVTDGNDGHNEGLQLEQQGIDSQNI